MSLENWLHDQQIFQGSSRPAQEDQPLVCGCDRAPENPSFLGLLISRLALAVDYLPSVELRAVGSSRQFSAFRGEGMAEIEFTPPPPRGAEKLCG